MCSEDAFRAAFAASARGLSEYQVAREEIADPDCEGICVACPDRNECIDCSIAGVEFRRRKSDSVEGK